VADPAPLQAMARRLADFSLAFFVSPNAVRFALDAMLPVAPWPAGVQVATVGKGSEAALAERGFTRVIAPSIGFDSEAVLALPAFQADAVAGRRVLVLRGDGGRDLLGDTLTARGARVEYLCCYHRGGPADDPAILVDRARAGRLDALTLTSSEGVAHLLALPGPRCSRRCRSSRPTRASPRRPGRAVLPRWCSPAPAIRASSTASPPTSPLASPAPIRVKLLLMSDIPSLPPVESASPVQPRPSAWRRPSVIIAAVALALLGWQWVETRSRLADLQEDLARRLTDGDTAAKEARALARQAQENLQDLQGKVGALDAKLSESQGQQVALEAMYQEFSRSRDDRVLAEVEQAVAIAAQQLQLAGNVHAALFALQAADARLGSVDRPQWLPLRKAIAADLDTLKALPQVDSSGIALKLETLIGRLDRLPLAFEAKPRAASVKPDEAAPSWLKSLWADFWAEFSQLLRIERMDRPDPALLAPSNAVFLRENLKLRLMNARLALLSRDGNTFREDVRISREWLERYFDLSNAAAAAAKADLAELQAVPVGVELPTLQSSQVALHALQAKPEQRADVPRPLRPAANPAPAKKN
jgi:uncharacterized protein HemX/uroporphyrinogen-III synthase